MRIIFLDSSPLGLITNPASSREADSCRRWVQDMLASLAAVFDPEIADYEIRRELLRGGKRKGLARLDRLRTSLDYSPITTEVMHYAAQLWADARCQGRPTASPDALDGLDVNRRSRRGMMSWRRPIFADALFEWQSYC